MIGRFHLSIVAVLVGVATTDHAHAGAIEYDCDTPVGHYSDIKIEQSGPTYMFRGTISAKVLLPGKTYAPVANARIGSVDGKQSVGIRMVTSRPSTEVTDGDVFLMFWPEEKNGKNEPFGKMPMNTDVPFEIVTDGKGTAKVTFAGVERTLPFKVDGALRASASCSTGQFTFKSLETGPSKVAGD